MIASDAQSPAPGTLARELDVLPEEARHPRRDRDDRRPARDLLHDGVLAVRRQVQGRVEHARHGVAELFDGVGDRDQVVLDVAEVRPDAVRDRLRVTVQQRGDAVPRRDDQSPEHPERLAEPEGPPLDLLLTGVARLEQVVLERVDLPLQVLDGVGGPIDDGVEQRPDEPRHAVFGDVGVRRESVFHRGGVDVGPVDRDEGRSVTKALTSCVIRSPSSSVPPTS